MTTEEKVYAILGAWLSGNKVTRKHHTGEMLDCRKIGLNLIRLCTQPDEYTCEHARYLRPDAEDLAADKAHTLRAGLDELQIFIGNLTDDDTSYEKRARMLDTLSELLKLL